MRMKHRVPATSTGMPADLKGTAGGTLANAPVAPIALSLGLKAEISKLVGKYAAGKTSLTADEFRKFLEQEQKVSLRW